VWILRELTRLLWTIAVATAIASAVASLWALASTGSLLHDLRIGYFLFGALLILLAGAGGGRSTVQGRIMTYTWFTGIRGYGMFSPGRARPSQPTLTASAVFVGSGLALFVLGAVV
jgi:hypothetical protein